MDYYTASGFLFLGDIALLCDFLPIFTRSIGHGIPGVRITLRQHVLLGATREEEGGGDLLRGPLYIYTHFGTFHLTNYMTHLPQPLSHANQINGVVALGGCGDHFEFHPPPLTLPLLAVWRTNIRVARGNAA